MKKYTFQPTISAMQGSSRAEEIGNPGTKGKDDRLVRDIRQGKTLGSWPKAPRQNEPVSPGSQAEVFSYSVVQCFYFIKFEIRNSIFEITAHSMSSGFSLSQYSNTPTFPVPSFLPKLLLKLYTGVNKVYIHVYTKYTYISYQQFN